jgi:hypothetical protein
VVYWAIRSRTPFRWFVAGAAVWSVGVGLKVVCAAVTYGPLEAIWASPTRSLGYLLLGALYSGVLTGVFEDGTTLAAGHAWRSWAREPKRAAAIGLGAGSWEAFLLAGVPMALATLGALLSPADRPSILSALSESRVAAALPWLIMPLERMTATIGHTATRMLALYAVASGRLRYFGYAFLLSVAVDGFAEWFLSGSGGEASYWWAMLGYMPPTIISIPLIIWCYRHWPRPVEAPTPAPASAAADALSAEGMPVGFTSEAAPWDHEAAPADDRGGQSGVSPRPQPYSRAQPAWHMVVLSLMTGGLYHLYWFYRNWCDLREQAGVRTRAGWRAAGMLVPVLNFFLALRQFREVKQMASAQAVSGRASPGWLAFGYGFLSLAEFGMSIWPVELSRPGTVLAYTCAAYAITLPATLLLVPVQRTLNGYWAAVEPGLPVRIRLSGRELLVLVAGAALMALVLAGLFL